MTFEEAVKAIPPGRYCHFKGNEYEVLMIARHSETEEPMVVYRALYGDGGVWVRPAEMWTETVERDGQFFLRFERVVEPPDPEKKVIPLSVILDAIEQVSDAWEQFYNVITGEVKAVPTWESGLLDVGEFQKTAEEIENSEDYIRLPNQYELHEYSIMENFAEEKNSDDLRQSLHRRRPYRSFKDRAIELGLDQEYYAYRTAAYREIARQWCRDHEIPYTEMEQ